MADLNDILRQMQMNMAAQNQQAAAKSITKGAVPLAFGLSDTQCTGLSLKTGWADNSVGGQGGPFGSLFSSGGTFGCRGPGGVRTFANSVSQGFRDAAQGAQAFMATVAHQQSAMSQIAYSGSDFIGNNLSRGASSFVNMIRGGLDI